MSQHEHRGAGHGITERRHSVRTRLTLPGIALAITASTVMIYQLWSLIPG